MKVDTEELVDNLSAMRESYIYQLIKSEEFSEWKKGILAGKIDAIDELILFIEKGN